LQTVAKSHGSIRPAAKKFPPQISSVMSVAVDSDHDHRFTDSPVYWRIQDPSHSLSNGSVHPSTPVVVDALPDAYLVRQLEEQQVAAVAFWARRHYICCILQIVSFFFFFLHKVFLHLFDFFHMIVCLFASLSV
jgi:hypothetical protein